MQRPVMRIPYTGPLPPPRLIPRNVDSLPAAVAALAKFILAPPSPALHNQHAEADSQSTVVLSGAGISVASGLADYRGVNGTYRRNTTYRPIYYHEFLASHEARKRYWARSFLGWTNLHKARPNATHHAIRHLADMGMIRSVITQNVDSFHIAAHPMTPTLELHGYLRALVCVNCHREMAREDFQVSLTRLNPRWADFLEEVVRSGALETEDPVQRLKLGIKTNPDGDVDLPDAPYTTFRYPACPHCVKHPPQDSTGKTHVVNVDEDGAFATGSSAGILKPSVVMFGESIADVVKTAAEEAIDRSGRLLVLGTSLATYSAWRLAKRAVDRGMPIAILNVGGVRGEETFFKDLPPDQTGEAAVRIELPTEKVLPKLVDYLSSNGAASSIGHRTRIEHGRPAAGFTGEEFKDMLS